jgi:hypothetical protein
MIAINGSVLATFANVKGMFLFLLLNQILGQINTSTCTHCLVCCCFSYCRCDVEAAVAPFIIVAVVMVVAATAAGHYHGLLFSLLLLL